MSNCNEAIGGSSSSSISLSTFLSRSSFRYLPNLIHSQHRETSDLSDFNSTVQALRTIGFSSPEIQDLFDTLGAVLQLGEVGFCAESDGNSSSNCSIRVSPDSEEAVSEIERLLKCHSRPLAAALCHREIQITTGTKSSSTNSRQHGQQQPQVQKVSTNLSLTSAFASRDAFARQMYGLVFRDIVSKLNGAMAQEARAKEIPGRGSRERPLNSDSHLSLASLESDDNSNSYSS